MPMHCSAQDKNKLRFATCRYSFGVVISSCARPGLVIEVVRPGFPGRADSGFFEVGFARRRGDGGMASSFKERVLTSTSELLKSLFFGFPKRSSTLFSKRALFSFLCFSNTAGSIAAKALTGSAVPRAANMIASNRFFIFETP